MQAPLAHKTSRPKPKAASSVSGFWGDLDDYLPDEEDVFEETAVAEEGFEPMKAEAGSAETAAGYAGQQSPAPDTAVVAAGRETPSAAAPADSAALQPPSPALADEIKSLQHRYIVGKAAGEALYDTGGALIIAKGSIITTDTITAAERAGKLPELIVHMVIPGFEADRT
jgi:hypothetical protein